MVSTLFSHDMKIFPAFPRRCGRKRTILAGNPGIRPVRFHIHEIAGLCKRTVKTAWNIGDCSPKPFANEIARRKIFIFRDFSLDKRGADAYTEPINPPAMTRRTSAHSF
jgi:hypothetical protein